MAAILETLLDYCMSPVVNMTGIDSRKRTWDVWRHRRTLNSMMMTLLPTWSIIVLRRELVVRSTYSPLLVRGLTMLRQTVSCGFLGVTMWVVVGLGTLTSASVRYSFTGVQSGGRSGESSRALRSVRVPKRKSRIQACE